MWIAVLAIHQCTGCLKIRWGPCARQLRKETKNTTCEECYKHKLYTLVGEFCLLPPRGLWWLLGEFLWAFGNKVVVVALHVRLYFCDTHLTVWVTFTHEAWGLSQTPFPYLVTLLSICKSCRLCWVNKHSVVLTNLAKLTSGFFIRSCLSMSVWTIWERAWVEIVYNLCVKMTSFFFPALN